jgi:hypothetical protein
MRIYVIENRRFISLSNTNNCDIVVTDLNETDTSSSGYGHPFLSDANRK